MCKVRARIVVHVHADTVLEYLAKDTHYRNQFETGTSCGALSLDLRENWERNLFGDAYDDVGVGAKDKGTAFDRCKCVRARAAVCQVDKPTRPNFKTQIWSPQRAHVA